MRRRYLGKVGKFYRTLSLISPRHCISILSKSVKYCRSHRKRMLVCVFMPHAQCRTCSTVQQIRSKNPPQNVEQTASRTASRTTCRTASPQQIVIMEFEL